MVLLEEPLSHPRHLYFQRNCARYYLVYLYEVTVPEKKRCLIILVTLFLLLLTLQPFMGFGLLHQIIPGFSILDELVLISQFQFL
jgi:hypothetical protein